MGNYVRKRQRSYLRDRSITRDLIHSTIANMPPSSWIFASGPTSSPQRSAAIFLGFVSAFPALVSRLHQRQAGKVGYLEDMKCFRTNLCKIAIKGDSFIADRFVPV